MNNVEYKISDIGFGYISCVNILTFTPTIDIGKASTVPSSVSASFAFSVAIWSVVNSAPYAAADVFVRLSGIFRRWNNYQKCDTDQQQHWAAIFHHFYDFEEKIFAVECKYYWCFSDETQTSTAFGGVALRIYTFGIN